MAEESARNVLLVSVRPRYAKMILSGKKRVEFRRSRPTLEPAYMILYATNPEKAVVGWAEVQGIEADAPAALWERYGEVGGIDRQAFLDYYNAKDVGVAIKLGRVFRLSEPQPLSRLGAGTKAPRSFHYVDDATLRTLQGFSLHGEVECRETAGCSYEKG